MSSFVKFASQCMNHDPYFFLTPKRNTGNLNFSTLMLKLLLVQIVAIKLNRIKNHSEGVC